MGKYLHKFETGSDFEAYLSETGYRLSKPWVSYTKTNTTSVDYNNNLKDIDLSCATLPNFLQSGDKVAIVAPSSSPDAQYITDATTALEEWGLVVDSTSYMVGVSYTGSGEAASHADTVANLTGAFEDPTVKAIICARGGYGGIHILDLLPEDVIRNNPKWFIGYSDITSFEWCFLSYGLQTIHGPMCSSFTSHPDDDGSTEKLRKILFGESGYNTHSFTDENSQNRIGTATGILVGGNLSTFLPYLNGKYSPFNSASDFILYVEDNGTLYKRNLYRFMKQIYYTAGEKLKGVLVGVVPAVADNAQNGTRYSIIKACIPDIPIAFTDKIGHNDINYPVINGSIATLNVSSTSNSTITFNQTAVKASYNLQKVKLSNFNRVVVSGESFTTTIYPLTGYKVNSVSVKMGETDITSTAYNSSTNVITINNVTRNIEISVSAVNILPSGYQLLDYIVCTGDQYLDTGVTGNSYIKAALDFNITELISGTPRSIFGRYTTSTGSISVALGITNTVTRFANRSKSYDWTVGDHTFEVSRAGTVRDGVTSTWSAPSSITTGSLYLGYSGTVDKFKGYIRSCKIWDNDVLVRDFIPCKNTSNVVGMYDTVNEVFYQSATETPFNAPA